MILIPEAIVFGCLALAFILFVVLTIKYGKIEKEEKEDQD